MSSARKSGKVFVHVPRGPLNIVNQLDASLIAALCGAGIAPSSLPVVLPYLKAERLKLLLPNYRVVGRDAANSGSQIRICYAQRQYLPVKVRVLVDFLVDHFRAGVKLADALEVFAA